MENHQFSFKGKFSFEVRNNYNLVWFLQIVELKPGGAQIPVTESNKKEYLDLLAQYRLSSSVKQEIEAFAKGSPFLIATPILQKREGTWPELTFAKTSGTVTRDRETMDRYDPRNSCCTHFGSSSLLVFKVANRGLGFFWFSSPRVLKNHHFQISIDQEFIYRN